MFTTITTAVVAGAMLFAPMTAQPEQYTIGSTGCIVIERGEVRVYQDPADRSKGFATYSETFGGLIFLTDETPGSPIIENATPRVRDYFLNKFGDLGFVDSLTPTAKYSGSLSLFEYYLAPLQTLVCLTDKTVESFTLSALVTNPDGSILLYDIRWENPGGMPIAMALDWSQASDSEYALFGVTPPEPTSEPAPDNSTGGHDVPSVAVPAPLPAPNSSGNQAVPDLVLGLIGLIIAGGLGTAVAIVLHERRRTEKKETPDA